MVSGSRDNPSPELPWARYFSIHLFKLEIVFTKATPAFHNLFVGCIFDINTVHKTVEKWKFQEFY